MNSNSLMRIFLVSVALSSPVCFADTISIRADSWFPINGEPESDKTGYMIDLAVKIFGDAEHTVDYRLAPWERAVADVRKGKYDCVVGAYKEDAPDFVYPEESWGLDESAFFVKQGETWKYTGLSSIENVKLGLVGGYAYGEDFDAYIKANNKGSYQFVKGDNALEKNIKKLLGGRITATVESPLVMYASLKGMGIQGQIIEAGMLGEPSDMYIACSPAKKGSKDLVSLVDEGTRRLRSSGELKTILDQYGLSDWK